MNIFEKASKLKLKFNTVKGVTSVEDLWDVNLNTGTISLADIGNSINAQLKEEETTTDVFSTTKDTDKVDLLRLKFDIVKHIFDFKKAEQAANNKAKENKKYNEKILRKVAELEDKELDSMSKEELLDKLK